MRHTCTDSLLFLEPCRYKGDAVFKRIQTLARTVRSPCCACVRFGTSNLTALKLLTQENVLVGGFFVISGYAAVLTIATADALCELFCDRGVCLHFDEARRAEGRGQEAGQPRALLLAEGRPLSKLR